MSDERHRALKRWERAKQLSGVRADPDLVGPPAYCLVRGPGVEAPRGEAPERISERIAVYIVAMFTKDLTCVKACREPLPAGIRNAWWLVRGGIRWEDYLRGIVRHYSVGLPVPIQFRPVRKIGSGIVA